MRRLLFHGLLCVIFYHILHILYGGIWEVAMKARWWRWLVLFVAAILFSASMESIIRERAQASVLQADTGTTMAFRRQYVSLQLYEALTKKTKSKSEFFRVLTSSMLNGDFCPKELSFDSSPYIKYKRQEFYQLQKLYEAVWGDVECFPLTGGKFSYEDTFGAPRTYGGDRVHEGTDLFGEKNISGYYPVLSMTDGVVEQIGWLPLGGYRLGIRAEGGAYFYYAHLSQYEMEFIEGETVAAGDILGYMGNTGYGQEGTVGKFPVHLHLGIYITTEENPELSVNPYWILRSAEKKMRKYIY